MKKTFRSKHYANDEEVKPAVMKWLKEQSTEFYKERIQALIRWRSFAIERNDYVET